MSFRRSDYSYALPPSAIASRPPESRTAARLLVMAREADASVPVKHASFGELGSYLRRGDCLVLNETRVVPARLYGVRPATGGRLELLLVRRRDASATAGEAETWEALGRPGKRLRPGTDILLEEGALAGEILEDLGDGRRLVRLAAVEPGATVAEMIARHGHMPLPPYIDRADDARDRSDYQTVFARVPGAVAAPTAGLHFTDALLAELGTAGIAIARLVLHVGPGTFKPVTADDVREHRLDPERYVLTEENAALIRQTRSRGGRIVAVGTTVVRTLEAIVRDAPAEPVVVAGEGEAGLFIYPPFEFRMVDAMITNFHLPESTLLMLVAAFAGRERTLAAYREAVELDYRFYSYGDAMLIA